VCVVVRLESRDGQDRKLAALMDAFALRVRDAEPDCTSYVVTRPIGSREHFAAHAHFASWDAFNAHAETPHLARVLPRLTALLAAPISMEIFLELPRASGEFRVGDAWREIEAQRQSE
jgi:quinol monooxygenase YgiN